jgi:predicted nucleic acid-binding protein
MAGVILDTDVASRLHKGLPVGGLINALDGKLLCITFITIAEALQGAHEAGWPPNRVRALLQFYQQFIQLPWVEEIPFHYGRLAGRWRREATLFGRDPNLLPINDTWIAACCLAFGLPLATLNRKDFEPFVANGLILL